jgi:anti-sigma-K factor RskA
MAEHDQLPEDFDAGVAAALARAVWQTDPPAALRARVLSAIAGATTVQLKPDPASTPAEAETPGRTSGFTWLALAASLALAVAFGVYAVQLRNRIHADESRLAVLAAADVKRVDLAGQPAAPRAAAQAYWSRSRGMVFTASNLPALPAGRVYQLWVITAQPAPISAGLIKPDAVGGVNAVFNTPADIPTPVAMAVTIEPDGGVAAPTGDKYLVGVAH